MNILDDRKDKYGRKDPREIRVNNQYDTATINQNRRSSTNPRSGGYDERKVEIHPKNGIKESFEVGNWARERFGEDEDDDRNNFDSGTFSAFYSKDKNVSVNLSEDVSVEDSHEMRNLFDRIKNGKYVFIFLESNCLALSCFLFCIINIVILELK